MVRISQTKCFPISGTLCSCSSWSDRIHSWLDVECTDHFFGLVCGHNCMLIWLFPHCCGPHRPSKSSHALAWHTGFLAYSTLRIVDVHLTKNHYKCPSTFSRRQLNVVRVRTFSALKCSAEFSAHDNFYCKTLATFPCNALWLARGHIRYIQCRIWKISNGIQIVNEI